MSKQDVLKLKVLGCGDAFSSGGRRQTSFLVQTQEAGIMVDCGATTALALKQEGLDFNEVDYVIITHFHGDHYGGLPYLIIEAAKYRKRKKQLTLIAPPGLEDKLYQLTHLLYRGSEDALKSFPIHYISYKNEQEVKLPFGRLVPYEVKHASGTKPHGVFLEMAEKKMAYSGDTSWHPNLPKMAEDTDLFICECNFYESSSSSHIHYKMLEEKLPELKSKKIVLTHLGEEMLKNQQLLKIEVLHEGQEIFL